METTLKKDQLRMNDPPTIVWVLVRDAVKLLWNENPKMHDVGAIIQSIKKNEFQELPKFDANLRNVTGGKGAIKSGNGRTECLDIMERSIDPETSKRYELPGGCAITIDEGYWAMPIIVGTDAENEAKAKAYAIDSNNLTMLGGDFTAIDLMNMWGDSYLELIKSIDINDIVSVTGDDVDIMEWMSAPVDLDDLYEQYGDPRDGDYNLAIHVRVPKHVMAMWDAVMASMPLGEEHERVEAMLTIVKDNVK